MKTNFQASEDKQSSIQVLGKAGYCYPPLADLGIANRHILERSTLFC